VRGDGAQYGVECSRAQRVMIRNAQPLMLGRISFNDDMAADLVNLSVAPTATRRMYELPAAKISRQFHPVASTSSRTR
jgi:hypothetical protein